MTLLLLVERHPRAGEFNNQVLSLPTLWGMLNINITMFSGVLKAEFAPINNLQHIASEVQCTVTKTG